MMRKTGRENKPLKNFIRNFRRGLGSTIIELKENPDREEYRAIVMRFCLKDIAYDTQVEGTKGFYLYTAIKTFVNSEIFLDSIAEKFTEKLPWRLFEQLCDILCCFANDACQRADEALEKKYVELKNRLPLIHDDNYGEREQFERLMIKKLDGGFEAFRQCVSDMGEMIIKRGDDDCLWYDSFLDWAEDKLGKGIYSFLKNAGNNNTKAFSRMYKKSKSGKRTALSLKLVTGNEFCKTYKPLQDEVQEERITIELLVSRANELLSKTAPNPFFSHLIHMRQFSYKFAQQANQDELKTLARITIDESSDFIRAALLRVFSFVDFPLDIELLLPYATSDNEALRDVAVKALSRIKDQRIHALAVRLFDNAQVENAIALLEVNFEFEDEILIRKYIMRAKRVVYEIIRSISEIYENHKSNTCGDILLYLYQNAECSHCRYAIVETMINNGVMSENILTECQYDSYEDTRILAGEELKNRNK